MGSMPRQQAQDLFGRPASLTEVEGTWLIVFAHLAHDRWFVGWVFLGIFRVRRSPRVHIAEKRPSTLTPHSPDATPPGQGLRCCQWAFFLFNTKGIRREPLRFFQVPSSLLEGALQ
jgi:hypothetical protein